MKATAFDLDRGIFGLALSVARANILPCTLAAVLITWSNVGQGYLSNIGHGATHQPLPFVALRALILMIVGYSAYRTLTSGGRITGTRAAATDDGRIAWRYAGVMLMILSPILLLGIVWTAPGGSGPRDLEGLGFGMALIVTYAVLYVLLGTALPEIAERGDASLTGAIARGWANYRHIARALVFGPWLFRAGSIAVMIGLGASGVTVDLFDPATGSFQAAALPPMLAFAGAHVFAEILTATVLVRAYRRHSATARAPLTA